MHLAMQCQARSGAILLSDMSQFLYVSSQQCQVWSGAILLSDMSQFLYASGQQCQVWSGTVGHSQMLSCYLICPNSFMCLASSTRHGQALPKSIVNSLLTSDHIIILCFSQPPMTIMITHSCMLMSLASIMPTLFLLDIKAYKFTKLDDLNFYGQMV